MKLIQYILLAAVFTGLALACDKTGPEGGNTGTPDGCPVTYVRFPAQTIYSGDRIPVIGSGFSDRADFFLVNTVSGTSIEIADVTVTASGIEMTVDAVAGEYIFVIEQDGRWELGTITVEARPIDVTVGTFPQYCIPGESLTVTGMGFAESATLTLESPDGTRTSLRTEASESSLTALIPDDSPKGRLKLIIVQDNGEQTVSSSFFVTTVKRLMTFRSTVGSGESTVVRELSFTRDGDGSVTGCSPFSLSVNQGSDGRTEYNFTASADNEDEGYYSFILKVDQGRNRVVSSTFELERTDPGSGQVTTVTEEFPWDYGNTGFLSWYDGRMSNELSAVDGNINIQEFDGSYRYVYDNNELINNPFGVDCTIGLIAGNSSDYILASALVLGATGQKSALLPSGIYASGTEADLVSYEYDGEGYVTTASYGESSSLPVVVEFIYE